MKGADYGGCVTGTNRGRGSDAMTTNVMAAEHNPYSAALDHRSGSSAIIRNQSEHSKSSPTDPAAWGWWWYTTGELHAVAATFRADGGGHGSAADCFRRAADKFSLAGDVERAALCRDLHEARLRLAARA